MGAKLELRRKRRIRSYLINSRYQLKCVALVAGTGILLVFATVAILFVFIRENFVIWADLFPMSGELQLRLLHSLHQVVLSIALTSLVWIALICLFALVLSHQTAGPLYRFKRVFDEVRTGNLEIRIKLRPRDNFRDVAQSFNAMMESLRKNHVVDEKPAVLDQKGFGMVDVLVAAAIGGIVMLSMSSMMTSMSHSIRGSRTMASRDQLMTKIGREAGNPASLQASLLFTASAGFPSNVGGAGTPTMFEKCVNGTVTNGCLATDSSNNSISYGFTLTDVFGNPIAGPGLPLAGGAPTDANAAVYDVAGAPCPNKSLQAPNANCQILVTTTFTPKCSNNPVPSQSCTQASSITVSYTLYQASGISPPSGSSLLTLKPMTQSVTVPVPFPGTTTGIPNYLAKWLSNTQIGVSQVYEDTAGNVGIGTTSPSYKVDIQESRTDTASNNSAVSMSLTQSVAPTSSSGSWFIPLLVSAASTTNQNLNPGTTAIVGVTNWRASSASVTSAYGVDGAVRNVGSGLVIAGYGVEGKIDNLGSGTVQTAIGVQGKINSLGAGPINTAIGVHAHVNSSSSGPINTAIAGDFMIVPEITPAATPSTGYGVRIGTITATNKWSLYASDNSAPSYFAGSVGVGTATPAYPLDVAGDINTSTCIRTSAGIASGTCSSDERLKTDIHPFTLGLDALSGINPKTYRYNGLGDHPISEKPELGVIAQDVEKTAAELVSSKSVKLSPTDTHETQIKVVNYNALIYILINSVKELHHKITALADQLSSLMSESDARNLKIMALEQENTEIKTYLCSKDPAAPFCK